LHNPKKRQESTGLDFRFLVISLSRDARWIVAINLLRFISVISPELLSELPVQIASKLMFNSFNGRMLDFFCIQIHHLLFYHFYLGFETNSFFSANKQRCV